MVITQQQKDCLHPDDQWASEDIGGRKFKITCKVCGLQFEYNQKTDKKTLYENPDDSP